MRDVRERERERGIKKGEETKEQEGKKKRQKGKIRQK